MLLAIPFSITAVAHTPQDMVLSYDFEEQIINVTITHNVPTPNTHYIKTVEIYKNEVLFLIQNYTNQPSPTTFTYPYPVTAEDGDVLKVTSTCSISGNITREIKVQEPVLEPDKKMVILLGPDITEINENSSLIFNVSLESEGTAVSGASLKVVAGIGTISNIVDVASGKHKFTYTAGEVTEDTLDRINVTAIKEGYENSYFELELSIVNIETGDGNGSGNGNGGGEVNDTDEKKPTLDGKIDSNEYAFDAAFMEGLYKIYWKYDDDMINIALVAKTKGWVALGLEPKSRMEDADMIIGWVTSSGTVRIVDAYSTGPNGPHPSDVSLGGTSDILEYGGSQENNWTIIEFSRMLDTGDKYDKKIPLEGEMDIIWAYGSKDDDTIQHTERGAGVINLTSGESKEKRTIEWKPHALLMSLGLLSILLGITFLKSGKNLSRRIPAHKFMNTMGVIFAILGLLYGFYMIQISTGLHFNKIHTYLGVITLIFMLITLRFGFIIIKFDPDVDKIRYRQNHRWIGRIAVILLCITIISGLSIAGVI